MCKLCSVGLQAFFLYHTATKKLCHDVLYDYCMCNHSVNAEILCCAALIQMLNVCFFKKRSLIFPVHRHFTTTCLLSYCVKAVVSLVFKHTELQLYLQQIKLKGKLIIYTHSTLECKLDLSVSLFHLSDVLNIWYCSVINYLSKCHSSYSQGRLSNTPLFQNYHVLIGCNYKAQCRTSSNSGN